MGIEMQSKEISTSEGQHNFQFTGDVDAFVYGVSGVDVFFPDNKTRNLQTFGVNLIVNQPKSNTVSVQADVTLTNGKGKYASSSSKIAIVVVAWVGDDADRNVSMNNADELGSAPSFAMGGDAYFAQALMSGFELSYAPADHELQSMNASVGVQTQGSTATLTGTASMSDDNSNSATTAYVDGAYIAALKSDPGFGCSIAKVDGYGYGQKVEFVFEKDVEQVVTFLLSYDFSYGSGKQDFQVSAIRLGNWSVDTVPVSIQGNRATTDVALVVDKKGDKAPIHSLSMAAIGRYKN